MRVKISAYYPNINGKKEKTKFPLGMVKVPKSNLYEIKEKLRVDQINYIRHKLVYHCFFRN